MSSPDGSGPARKLGIGCGAVALVFVVALVWLMIEQSNYEDGWRHVVVFNTSDVPLQIGVEEENEEWWTGETVEPGDFRGFKVEPGRVRAILVDPDGTIRHRGERVIDLLPGDEADPDERIFVGATTEGTLAIVDAAYMYEGMLSAPVAAPRLVAAFPAGEIAVWKDEAGQGGLKLPMEKLPESVRHGRRVFAMRYVNASIADEDKVIAQIAESLESE